jgi:hypothetical protein
MAHMSTVPKVARREPAVFATGVVTLLATILYVAPSLGVEFPDTVAKVVSLVLTVAAGFGIRSAVTPINAAPKAVAK